MHGFVVDLFIASPDNAPFARSATNLALSMLAFVGVVGKSVELHYRFECRVW